MHPGNKLAMLGTLLQILAATICLQSPGNRNLDVLDLGIEVQPISPEFRSHLSDPGAAYVCLELKVEDFQMFYTFLLSVS